MQETMTALSDYIRQLLEQGYEQEQIESFLRSKGYSEAVLTSSMHQARQDERTHKHHRQEQATLYQQLYTYTHTMLERGFTPQQISRTLHDQGYHTTVIKGIFRHVNKTYYNGTLDLEGILPEHSSRSRPKLLALVIIIVVIASIAFATTALFGDGETGPSTSMTPSLDDETGLTEDETGSETGTEEQTRSEHSSTGTDTTESSDTAVEPSSDTPVVRLDDTDANSFEGASMAENREEAVRYCNDIQGDVLRRDCYSTLAKRINESAICTELETTEYREDCYVDLILNGNHKLCANVTLPENKQLCAELELLSDYEGNMQETE